MMRVRAWKPRAIGLLCLLWLLAPANAPAQQQRAATTVILVRHAEKAAQPAADPPLTPDGGARALALIAVARDAGVSTIITTQFVRTKATAEPIANALHITPIVLEARGAKHAQDVAQAILTGHAGEVVLVVGHSNTLPAIIAALGAGQVAPICDSEYDGLYVVTIPPSGPARLIRARYGAPSRVAAECASQMR